MVLATARKPEGGFQFISVAHLCAVWCAYRQTSIRLPDVRLWCAAHEMVARRCQLAAGQQPVYQQSELHHLVGGRGGVTAGLARLQTTGLLAWHETALTFPPPPLNTDAPLAAMLAQIPNPHRRVPVPRRLLRFLAKRCSRALLATILGHLFRCLYYRQGQCRAEGFCKASWIAEVFGVSERAVKSARHRLETLGFLQRTETPQWVRNRYGQKMTINLQWDGATRAAVVPPASGSEPAPLPVRAPHKIARPDSDIKLLTEEKHQKPAAGGPVGVLSTLFAHARECLRNGTTLLEASEPVLPPPAAASAPLKPALTPRRKITPAAPPSLQQVTLLDLQDMERLLALHTQALRAHLLRPSEAERLSFVALAVHVLHFRPANPGGLFIQLLRQRRFDFITQEEEDQARRRLNAYLYPAATRSSPLSVCAGSPPAPPFP